MNESHGGCLTEMANEKSVHNSTFWHFSMLRGLLRDSEAAKALFEKMGLFRSPELLEKYVIASEVTIEVLDVFLSRVFGTERGCISNESGDLKALWESLGCVALSGERGADGVALPAQHGESSKEMKGLRGKVQDLERQLCALQRQLQMQGEVSQLAVSLEGRLDEIARECERQVSDVRTQASAVSEDVARLKEKVGGRASTGDVMPLSEEVARLKDGEQGLVDRINETAEARRVLRDELQGEIMRLDAVVKVATEFEFPCIESQSLDGIIAHLTRVFGGNLHDKGVIEVTASSCSSGAPKSVTELGTDSFFYSTIEENSWIRYDFKGRRVTPTSYSIRSHNGYCHPQSWVLEVSNDGSEGSWAEVDARNNIQELNGNYLTRNFAIRDPPRGTFRFVRLRHTGPNHHQENSLYINSLELFGKISPQ